jgi:hypothetical protein
MKKSIIILSLFFAICERSSAQDVVKDQTLSEVTRLDNARSVKEYIQLAADFSNIAEKGKSQWLPYYYAAFCNAKVGWLYQEDPDKIEPFADKADELIKKALSLLDTANQKKQLSEVYTVLSMVNQARVFMNPATYGRHYGPIASQYVKMAIKANPNNPRAIYLDGWAKDATPRMWGGDKVKAKELALQAKQVLDSEATATTEPHWGKFEVEELLKKLK